MSTSHAAPGPRPERRRWYWLAVVLMGTALTLWWFRPPAKPPAPQLPPHRSRAELELREGQFFAAGSPFTGFLIEAYADGQLRSRSTVSNGWLEGLSEGWHTNGVLQVTEYFHRGLSHGVRTKFYPDGRPLSRAQINAGQIEGSFERWHENGQLAEKVFLTNGVGHGESLAFYPDGSPKARVQLEYGKIIKQQFWPASESNFTPPH